MHPNRAAAAVAALLSLAVAGAACATTVDVRFGPAVQRRMGDLGASELQEQADYLKRDVLTALRRAADPPSAVALVIEDIEPNRPTSAELGMSPQLQQSSFGLGGVAVTGQLTTADGRVLPIRYRFFPQLLANEVDFTTWGDAGQGFDQLSALIGAGKVPDDPSIWPPPHRARAVTGTRIPG